MSSQLEIDKKKLAEKHKRILTDLLKKEGNNVCADCFTSNPRWASWNLGVFLCIRCGGVHRAMGTHISKVKSLSLDNWTPDQIEHFRGLGNSVANQYFYPNVEQKYIQRSDGQLERYIRDKYERRLYIDRANRQKDPTVVTSSAATSQNTYSASNYNSATTLENKKIRGMTKLKEMGFANVKSNLEALVRANYELSGAVRILTGGSPSPVSYPYPRSDPKIKQLVAMGFEDYAKNVTALTRCNGDVFAAIDFLVANPKIDSTITTTNLQVKSNQPSNFTQKPVPPPKKSFDSKPSNPINLLDMNSLDIQDSPASSTSKNPEPTNVFGDFVGAPDNSTLLPSNSNKIPLETSEKKNMEPVQQEKSVFDSDFIKSLYAATPTSSFNTNQQEKQNTVNNYEHFGKEAPPALGTSNLQNNSNKPSNFSEIRQDFASLSSNAFETYGNFKTEPLRKTNTQTSSFFGESDSKPTSNNQFNNDFTTNFSSDFNSGLSNDIFAADYSANKKSDIIGIDNVPTLSTTGYSLSVDQSPWAQSSSASNKQPNDKFDLMF
ncbi:hypothetical protein BB561_001625 [Smittium simulii]|uniref:Arf-GAP domain-containing protein n=1 Tax=Smittium simulii TaxID=133385 RepID=A0A2T9YTQ6_9FUNG|nr:hypothetical protein BB561_001625 [Smittium simulii]